jgi:uncharacterized OsmC-like protein
MIRSIDRIVAEGRTPMMTTTDEDQSERIAAAVERLHEALANRPSFGRSLATSVTTLGAGLRGTTCERSHAIASDMAPALGGEGTAPNPTGLLRAALGACLAIGYRLHASEVGVELTSVRVTVESESELRGMLDPDACAPPGFTALRYHVAIESPSPADDVERVVELADRLSPVLDAITNPQRIERTVSITRPEA